MATIRSRKSVTTTTTPLSSDANDVTISIPKFDRSVYMPIMVILLLIASFLLGMLVTKVQYLEKKWW